jgi:hypothetical protein
MRRIVRFPRHRAARPGPLQAVTAAIAAVLLLVGLSVVGIASSSAADSDYNVSISTTGTGDCQLDTNTTDDVLCTNDSAAYLLSFQLPAGVTTTLHMKMTLPAGYSWDKSADEAACSGSNSGGVYSGTLTITANPDGSQTYDCRIVGRPLTNQAFAGFFQASFRASPDIANGSKLQPTLTVTDGAGNVLDTDQPGQITIVSQPQVDLRKDVSLVKQDSTGYTIRVVVTGQQMFPNDKGAAQLASPFTFTDLVADMTPGGASGAVLVTPGDCRVPVPNDVPTTNADAGTWDCSQAGPGQPVHITITGADTGGTVGQVTADGGIVVFSGAFDLFVPRESIPSGSTFTGTDRLTDFDPTDVSGTSNYGSGLEPGGDVNGPCDNNCADVDLINNPNGEPGVDWHAKEILQPNGAPLPNDGGMPLIGPGQQFESVLEWLPGIDDNTTITGLVMCDEWDPTQQQINLNDLPTVKYVNTGNSLNFTLEYTNDPSITNGASCTGGGNWNADPAAVGGPEKITAVRALISDSYSHPQTTGFIHMTVQFTNVDATYGDQVIDNEVFTYTGGPEQKQFATYAVTGNFVTMRKFATDPTTGQETGSVTPGTTLPYTLSVKVTNFDDQPQVQTIVDALPACLVNPTLDPASSADWTMAVSTPADNGPDGVACTNDAGEHGATLTFVSTHPLDDGTYNLNYSVTVSPTAKVGAVETNKADISNPHNGQRPSSLHAEDAVQNVGAGLVGITKEVDQPQVQVGEPIGFTGEFYNTGGADYGRVQWIDVLPWNGDSRVSFVNGQTVTEHSSFHGSLSLVSADVVLPPSGVTVEYTSQSPASVSEDPSDPTNSNGSTVWCTAAQIGTGNGCPATIGDSTAIRFTVADFAADLVGAIHLVMQPAGNFADDVYFNEIGPGPSDQGGLSPVPPSNVVRVDVVASSVGDTVWYDYDHNGVQDSGEGGIPGVTVELRDDNGNVIDTVVTDQDGHYLFGNLPSGTYQVTIVNSTLPPGVTPTYDLDNGTNGANGDSGKFPLGRAEDRRDVDFGYQPNESISTAISQSTASPGATIHDTVTMAGGESGTYTWTLYGPTAASGGACPTDASAYTDVVKSGTKPVSGDGSFTTDDVTLPSQAGCYSYGGSFTRTGGGGTPDATMAPGDPLETVLVSANTPTVTTDISATAINAGNPVSDQVTISGLGSHPEGVPLSWTLLGPVAPVNGSCAGLDWSSADPFDSGSFNVTGDGPVGTGDSQVIDQPGCYTYVETLAATGATTAVTTQPGVPSETVLVSPKPTATISTVAAMATAHPGATASDQVTITGLLAPATLTWQLLGPVPASGGQCPAQGDAAWDSADVADQGTVDVSADGPVTTTSNVPLTALGCYTFVDSLPATGKNSATSTPAGVPTETIQIVPLGTPVLSTDILQTTGTVGIVVNDAVTVSGTGATTVDWTLYGPLAPVNGSCAGLDWASADVVVANFFAIPGDGTYPTPNSPALDAPGCYTYADSVRATADTAAVSLAAGDPRETILVSPKPKTDVGVSTTISATTGFTGSAVHDSITITGLNGEQPQVDWSLIGPLAPVNGACPTDAAAWAGVQDVAGAGSFMADQGDATYVTQPDVTLNEPGCYTFVDTVAGTGTTNPFTTPAGDPNETVLITEKGVPAISTVASATVTFPGGQVSDAVSISGLGDQDVTLTWTLYGPVAPVNGQCPAQGDAAWNGAQAFDTGTVPVSGDGSVPTGPAKAFTDTGCYTFVDSLPATADTAAVTTPRGVPDETVQVQSKGTPAVQTVASVNQAEVGDSVSDGVEISGLGSQADPVIVTWTLLGPVAAVNGACDAVDWSNAPTWDTGTFTVSGDGTFNTGDAKALAQTGCYTFVESVPATGSTTPVTTAAGVPDETVLVGPATPAIATTASVSSGKPGLKVSDSIVLSGTKGAHPQIDWALLGPIDAVSGACPSDSSAYPATAIADSGTIPADGGDGTYTTPETTLDAKGCYSYVETVHATTTSVEVQSAAGIAAETVLVSPNVPAISTTISATTGQPGTAVHDTVEVSGIGGQAVTVTWRLLRAAQVNGSCVGVDWSSATQVDTGTVDFAGDGSHDTAATTLPLPGCYTYVDAVPATATTDAFSTPPGLDSESAEIDAFTPSIATTISDKTGQPGQSVMDSVTVSGMGSATSTMAWTLFAIQGSDVVSCENLDWSFATRFDSGTVDVKGDGTYTTPSVALTLPGCYTYVESLDATNTSTAFATLPGDPDETALITPFTPSVTTQASAQEALAGDQVHDTVVVTGTGSARPEISWQLIGPAAPVGDSCDGIDWSTVTNVAGAGSFTADQGDASYVTPDVTVPLPGCYTYVEHVAATDTSSAFDSPAGQATETALVSALTPQVSTEISNGEAKVGDTLSDSVTVDGTRGASLTIAWRLLGPEDKGSGSCTDVDWTDATVAASGSVTLDGDGTVRTPDVKITADGCYTYVETLAATATTKEVSTEPGLESETAYVRPLTAGLTIHKLVESRDGSGTYIEADDSDGRAGKYVAGESISWRLVVKNVGESPLADVKVSDPKVGDCARTIAHLAPDESVTIDCTSKATEALTNVATASESTHDLHDSNSARVEVSAGAGDAAGSDGSGTAGSIDTGRAGDGSGPSGWLIGLGGALVAIALGGAVLLLRRRRAEQ